MRRSRSDPETRTLREFVERHPRAFQRHQLVEKWGTSAVGTAVRRGHLVRVFPNAYVAAVHRDVPLALASALNAWCPAGLVSGQLALHLYSSQIRFNGTLPLVVSHPHHVHAPPGVRVRALTSDLPARKVNWVSCVTPEFALVDAWHRARPSNRATVFYEAMWHGVCEPHAVARTLEYLPRVSGRRTLVSLVQAMADGATSPLEILAKRQVFCGPLFSQFEWQGQIWTGSRIRRADLVHRGARVVVELDGNAWHLAPSEVRRDRARDVELLAAGYVTMRFGYADLVARPQQTRDMVMQVVKSRLAAQ